MTPVYSVSSLNLRTTCQGLPKTSQFSYTQSSQVNNDPSITQLNNQVTIPTTSQQHLILDTDIVSLIR